MNNKTHFAILATIFVITFAVTFSISHKEKPKDSTHMSYDIDNMSDKLGYNVSNKCGYFKNSDLPFKDGKVDLSKITIDNNGDFVADGKVIHPIQN